jgi:hypothetical protein
MKRQDFSIPEVPSGCQPDGTLRLTAATYPCGFFLARGLRGPCPSALYCGKSEEASGGRRSAEDEKENQQRLQEGAAGALFLDTLISDFLNVGLRAIQPML